MRKDVTDRDPSLMQDDSLPKLSPWTKQEKRDKGEGTIGVVGLMSGDGYSLR